MNKYIKLYNEALSNFINELPQPCGIEPTLQEITEIIDALEAIRVRLDTHSTKLLSYAYPIWKHKKKDEADNVR
jgi:hypothetical protein